MKKKSPKEAYLIMGLNGLIEATQHFPGRILEVYLLKTSSKTQPRKQKLIDRIQSLGLKATYVTKQRLDQICDSTSHQGFAARLKPLQYPSLNTVIQQAKKGSVILALDSIMDPQNLGAILRAAECFGVDAVIWSKNRGAQISAVVTKTSSAATELVPISLVSNLSSSLDQLKKAGYEIVTAEVGKDAKSLYQVSFSKKTVLVMGSEGKGVRPILSQKADHKLYIPMSGKIDSLNVSQATSVFLSHINSQLGACSE